MNQQVRSFGFICLALWASTTLAFQSPEIRVGVSADEIFVGESVDYTVEIRNTENPAAPDMSAMKELFDVVATGDQARNQSSTTIINGRVSQSVFYSHVYQFRLTPKQAGELLIPAPVATVDGKTLTGRKLSLRVIKPEPQDLVLAEINVSQTRVYPTQPFTVTLRIFVRPLLDDPNADPLRPLRRDPPHIEAGWVDTPDGLSASDKSEWLQPLLARRTGGFTLNNISSGGGFFSETAVFDLSNGRESKKDSQGETVRYFKYELTRTFTAERYGTYTFGPAVIKGAFVSGVGADGYLARRIVATTSAVEVEVREVPVPRPANFCGGIGEFSATARVSTTKLRVGDPLSLTLELKRKADSGSLELVSAPDLSAIEQLAADFEIIDKEPTGRVDGQVKEFIYVMRPKRAEANIPALSFSTFDPVNETFREVSTQPIALEVSGSVGLNSGDLVGTISPTSSSLKSRSEGIFQNITDPDLVRDESVGWYSWGQAIAGSWIASGITTAVVLLRRRKSSDTVGQRRQQARRNANRRVSEARNVLSRGDAQAALREVRMAVIGFVADSCNRVSEGLTPSDIDQILIDAKIAAEDRRVVKELLESIEALEYGAGLTNDPGSTIDDAAKWIGRVAPTLERRS